MMDLQSLRPCGFPELQISGGAFVMAALWLLTVPMEWAGAAVLAAAVHETGHLICLDLLKIPVFRIRIGAFGAKIETLDMKPRQELPAALSGPAAGLLLVLLWRSWPRCACCALIQTAWNLLPVFPTDGGRALAAMGRILREKWEKPVAEAGLSGYNDSD